MKAYVTYTVDPVFVCTKRGNRTRGRYEQLRGTQGFAAHETCDIIRRGDRIGQVQPVSQQYLESHVNTINIQVSMGTCSATNTIVTCPGP